MSILWMSTVWNRAEEYGGAKLLVLLALADRANDTGRCWPSLADLAFKARCSERWAREAVSDLEAEGWLTREMRPGRSTVYLLREPVRNAQESTPRNLVPPPVLEHGQIGQTPEVEFPPELSAPRNPSSPHPGSGVPPTPEVEFRGTIKEPPTEPSRTTSRESNLTLTSRESCPTNRVDETSPAYAAHLWSMR
jgi:hypothetical protein